MNLWATFRALMPSQPLLIGTVASVDVATGTSTLTLPGGGALTARGADLAVGQKAFVRAGVIEGPAPELDVVEIEV